MVSWKGLVSVTAATVLLCCPSASAAWGSSEWVLGVGREATVVVENQGVDEAWVRLHMIPRGRAGVVSPPLRLQGGQQMVFNLRYFLSGLKPGGARGRIKALYSGPRGRITLTLLAEQEMEGILYQTGQLEGEYSEDVIDGCEFRRACGEPDPDYVTLDRFEYLEWDVDGDGVTDPGMRSAMVVFDSDGNITWAESLYSSLQPFGFGGDTYHDEFCSDQVKGDCVIQRCAIAEYIDTLEAGPKLIGADFITTTECSDEPEPDVEVFGEDVSLDEPVLFYSGCVQAAGLHFNRTIDDEVAAAKVDLVEIVNDIRGLVMVAGGVTIGGILKDPLKMAGRMARSLPALRVVWGELRAIKRAHKAQLFVREQACGLVTAERLCYERMQEEFGSVQLQRNDIFAVLKAKHIDTGVVRRHCTQ